MDWLRNRIAVPGYIYLTNIPDYHLEDLLNHEMFACFSIASSSALRSCFWYPRDQKKKHEIERN